MNLSLRAKLVLSFGMVIGVTGAMATAVGMNFISGRIFAEMQNKAMHDLNSAREVYKRAMDDVRNAVRFNANRFVGRDALSGRDFVRARHALETAKQDESLDMLALVDRSGKVVYCAGNPAFSGQSLSGNALVKDALRKKDAAFANLILRASELEAFDPRLAERAHIRFVPTKMAKETTRTEETSGLVLAAVSPVVDDSGRLLGAIFGGRLLNRNYDIVDKAKGILYGDRRYKGRNIGTVTVFQGDLRIATNVLDESGNRAIGTRIARNVADMVLGQGKTYIGRAFVVNDWYLTAYEPIKGRFGDTVGILYVGILERPYTDMRREVFAAFSTVVLLGIGFVLALSYFLSGVVLKPVKKLMDGAMRIGKGDLSCRVSAESQDEFGELGKTFNLMASSLQERDEQIKVQAEQTMKTKRLATIGQLAAGVAHEVNNPLGGILVYTHLLLEDTGKDDPRRSNLEKIAKETSRVRDIVRGLLEFARQGEPKIEESDVNELLVQTLDFVNKQILFEKISIVKDLAGGLPTLAVDKDKIRQVLLNVMLNAVEAMEGRGGTLKLATRYVEALRQVEISVSDTGCGISPENLKRVFEPFFTTKEVGHGVGLGLAISYGIVKKHGGSIDIRSEAGRGTAVAIALPVNPEDRVGEESDVPSR